MAETIEVQVCYATATQAFLRSLSVAPATTIEQAIVQSGLLDAVPGLDLATHAVGIYGKKKALDTVLQAHDRIEIYRPLIADPKERRRKKKL
jgi:putative ubiquitin-RnfH superfamily antitoxin RatB of RatAB toxin-antitoxin module